MLHFFALLLSKSYWKMHIDVTPLHFDSVTYFAV